MIVFKLSGKTYQKAVREMGLTIATQTNQDGSVTKGNLVKIFRELNQYGSICDDGGERVAYRVELKSNVIGYINEVDRLVEWNKPAEWVDAVRAVRSQLKIDYNYYNTEEWNGMVYDIIWIKGEERKHQNEMESLDGWNLEQLAISMEVETC